MKLSKCEKMKGKHHGKFLGKLMKKYHKRFGYADSDDGMRHMKKHGHKFHKMVRGGHHMFHKMKHGHHKLAHGYGKHKVCRWNLPGREEPEADGSTSDASNDEVANYEPKCKPQISEENGKFQVCLDTSYYQPKEVAVKIIDGKIEVTAAHISMEEDMYEFHELYRAFAIPKGVNPDNITSHLDTNGKLLIEAPISVEEIPNNSREIPVIIQ